VPLHFSPISASTCVTVLGAHDKLGTLALGPYDVIFVTAAAPAIPPPLIDQLIIGGRIVIPVASLWSQELIVATQTPEGIEEEPLGGLHGFKAEESLTRVLSLLQRKP
jgi:protein-L-isoaspartate O-methyltransferase